MKVETNAKTACMIELTVKAEAADIQADYKKVESTFVREGVIPGFRKGKAPLALVQKRFHNEIIQEATQMCVRELYQAAIKEQKLEVLQLDTVTDVSFVPETGCSFKAVVEVPPKFDLPKYKKLAIKTGDTTVTDEQVAARVEDFRKAFAKYEEAKEGDVVAEGDFVQIDYTGSMKGKPLVEIVPDQKIVCENKDYWTQEEEGRFLPEILEALKGMKAGETKEKVTVKFAKEAAPEPLQGKKVDYSLTVKAIRKRQLPDDAAYLEGAKAESMDALRTRFRGQMETEAKDAELAKRRNQAIDLLLKNADFDVPPVFVNRQAQSYLQDLAQRAQYSGMPADYFEKNREKILADAENNATRQVRLSYILSGIVKAENLDVTDAEVDAGLEKVAANSRTKETGAELKKQLIEQGQLDGYKDQLKAEKALEFVLAEAKK